MFALPVSHFLHSRNIHYAWVVAAVTFFAMLTTSAALGLPGAMLKPLSAEFGWSISQLSSVFAVRFALFGLIGPFAAVCLARYGVRKVMLVAAACIASALILASHISALWQLFVLWGLLLGTGTGLTALVLGAIVANRWFTARRGLVVGVLAASTATGQLLFLPLAAWLIEHVGWRFALLPVVIAVLLSACAVWLLMEDRPQDLGLLPFGEARPAAQSSDAEGLPMPMGAGSGSAARSATAASAATTGTQDFGTPFRILRDVSGNQTFWILAGTFFICGLSTSGLVQTHFISLCGDRGLSAVPAAGVLALMGAFDLVGTTASGILSDRFDNRKLLFWYYGLRGLSLFWLPFSTFSLYGLSVFAMFYGLDWIATVPPTVKLCSAAFGRERSGMLFGWIFAAHQLGSAVAAYGAGLSRTYLLTYSPALFAGGSACLVAAVVIFGITRPNVAKPAMTAG